MTDNHFNDYAGGGLGLTRFEDGEILTAQLVDPNGREARHYDPGTGSGLNVNLVWEATGSLAGTMAIFGLGDWTVMVSADSRGAGPELTWEPVPIPTITGSVVGDRVRWSAQVPVTPAQLAELAEHDPAVAQTERRQGLYQFTVSVFWDANPHRSTLNDASLPDLIGFTDLNLLMVETVAPPEPGGSNP